MKALLPRLMPITFVAVVACSGNNIKVGNVVNDAGGPEVSKDATQGAIDCILASNLHYAAPGCGANAVAFCEAPKPERCLALRSVCGCDGKTTIYFDSCDGSSPSPYLYVGVCQTDAGSPDVPSPTDGGNDGPTPGSGDASAGRVTCDPFIPTSKAIAINKVLGSGRDSKGSVYVVDQGPLFDRNKNYSRVFLSSGGVLVRQILVGTNFTNQANGLSSSFYYAAEPAAGSTSEVTIALDWDDVHASSIRMAIARGLYQDSAAKQGEVLTLMPASDVIAMPIRNLPAEVLLQYAASLPDGRLLVVTRPLDDWTTLSDFRLFFGPPTGLSEHKVADVQLWEGGDSVIVFDFAGSPAQATVSRKSAESEVVDQGTLKISGTSIPLTISTTQPAGATYLCLDPSDPCAEKRATLVQRIQKSTTCVADSECTAYANPCLRLEADNCSGNFYINKAQQDAIDQLALGYEACPNSGCFLNTSVCMMAPLPPVCKQGMCTGSL